MERIAEELLLAFRNLDPDNQSAAMLLG